MSNKDETIIKIYTDKNEFVYKGKRLMEVLVEFSQHRLLSEIKLIKVI